MGLDALCPPGTLLVVAPHPDDESLGCGGLIACAADAGREVVVAVLTDGAASHPGSKAFPPARLAELRRAEVQAAVAGLAGDRARVEHFDAPDGGLQAVETEASLWLRRLTSSRRFGLIVAPWEADPHPDHKAAFRVARAAAEHANTPLLAYPVWGLNLDDEADAGQVAPCSRLDISAVLTRKTRAIAAHRSQTTSLIDDDPRGFRLSAADLSRHLKSYEAFLHPNEAPPR